MASNAPYFTSDAERVAGNAAAAVVRARARTLGVRIDCRFGLGGWHEIVATAPAGKRFAGKDIHEIVTANAGPTTDGLWQRLQADGLDVEDCDDPACEWCHDDED